MVTLFIGTIMYIEYVLIDMKTIFNRIDQLCEFTDSKSERLALECSREATILHARIIWYFIREAPIDHVLERSTRHCLNSFQLRAKICLLHEHHNSNDRTAVYSLYLHRPVHS